MGATDGIEEIDVVEVRADVPGTAIKAGMRGTVVIKTVPEGALLVEFSDCVGVPFAEHFFRPEEVTRVWSPAESARGVLPQPAGAGAQ